MMAARVLGRMELWHVAGFPTMARVMRKWGLLVLIRLVLRWKGRSVGHPARIQTGGEDTRDSLCSQKLFTQLCQLLKPIVRGHVIRKRLQALVRLCQKSKLTEHLRKPLHIRKELYKSETYYIESMEILLHTFLLPISHHSASHNFRGRSRTYLLEFIVTVEDMLRVHKDFLESLKEGRVATDSAADTLALCFAPVAEGVRKCYPRYVQLMPMIRDWVDSCCEARPDFSLFLFQQINTSSHSATGLSLGAYLIQPLQRVVGYSLMLERLVATMRHEDMQDHISFEGLVQTTVTMQEANLMLDSRCREHSRILAMQDAIAGLGARDFTGGVTQLIMEGDAWTVTTTERRSITRLGAMKREEQQTPCRLFMLTGFLLVTRSNPGGVLSGALYKFDEAIPLKGATVIQKEGASILDVVLSHGQEDGENTGKSRSRMMARQSWSAADTPNTTDAASQRNHSSSMVLRRSTDLGQSIQTSTWLRFRTEDQAAEWSKRIHDQDLELRKEELTIVDQLNATFASDNEP